LYRHTRERKKGPSSARDEEPWCHPNSPA